MLRPFLIAIVLASPFCAQANSSMIYLGEPINAYSERSKPKKQRRSIAKPQKPAVYESEKSPILKVTATQKEPTSFNTIASDALIFQGALGVVWENGFDIVGTSMLLSLEKPMPDLAKGDTNFFMQTDLALMFTPLKDSIDTLHTATYGYLAGFAGYTYTLGDPLHIKPRIGLSVVAPKYNLIFAFATSIEKRFFDDAVNLFTDISFMSGVFFITLGATYDFESH